jgi:hypothetical protein
VINAASIELRRDIVKCRIYCESFRQLLAEFLLDSKMLILIRFVPALLFILSFGSGQFEDLMLRISPNISLHLIPFFDEPSRGYHSGIPIPYKKFSLLRLAELLKCFSTGSWCNIFAFGIPN